MQAFSASTRTGLNEGGLDGTGPLADFHITSLCEETCAFMNLAFEAAGTLWVWTNAFSAGGYHFVAYSRAQLRNAQTNDQPYPVRELDFSLYGLPKNPVFAGALAFDPDGDLWVGGASDLARCG
jgi:hypothetical protein